MVHKLALTVGVLASVGILAVAVAGGGLFPRPTTVEAAQPQTYGQADSGIGGPLAPQAGPGDVVETVVDNVYIAPEQDPKVVRVRVTNPTGDTPDTEVREASEDDSEPESAENEDHAAAGEHASSVTSDDGDE